MADSAEKNHVMRASPKVSKTRRKPRNTNRYGDVMSMLTISRCFTGDEGGIWETVDEGGIWETDNKGVIWNTVDESYCGEVGETTEDMEMSEAVDKSGISVTEPQARFEDITGTEAGGDGNGIDKGSRLGEEDTNLPFEGEVIVIEADSPNVLADSPIVHSPLPETFPFSADFQASLELLSEHIPIRRKSRREKYENHLHRVQQMRDYDAKMLRAERENRFQLRNNRYSDLESVSPESLTSRQESKKVSWGI
ncbi:hypothetical protein BABINDRAFT_6127 [Babjeviella inositovora NRRL Y-12698]|uniref:Uncharacterized protein n=1 Tax=Babjeviella inositovora NRRL Y-12698 TaxID=984486 RepID=A0A1E3QUQ5_9ASCO|nr:uncharacterized protein BABINDRAFT_6127 [Babjeviella inositovora NRRL Y-12698]ODQ81423.1 hypothetical protein BABINDRAFT_6127 [Babjeviella inositovora NRRL Y-12698]